MYINTSLNYELLHNTLSFRNKKRFILLEKKLEIL